MAESKTPTTKNTSAALPKDIFSLEVSDHQLLHTAVRAHQASRREVSAKTLKRGEVSGGGKKPWRQKGTGRARAGSIRSPIWRGGGITFGPTGHENYQVNLPTKAKRLAIRQALSLKNKDGSVKITADLSLKEGKTKELAQWLRQQKAHRQILLVSQQKDEKLNRASGNLTELKVVSAKYLNVYDILRSDSILITTGALDEIKNWLGAAK